MMVSTASFASSRKMLSALAFALLIAGPPTALAQAQEAAIAEEIDGPYIVTWASANVRAAPTVDSARLAELTLGQFIDVTGLVEGEEWYRVQLEDGRIGYIWAEVLLPLRPDIFYRGGGGVSGGGGGGQAGPVASADLLPPSPGDNDFTTAIAMEPLTDEPQSFTGMVARLITAICIPSRWRIGPTSRCA